MAEKYAGSSEGWIWKLIRPQYCCSFICMTSDANNVTDKSAVGTR